jgi:hypothetical protein
MSDDDAPDLGPCCACGRSENVVEIYMLPLRNHVAGHGWGCVICGIPSNGASAVLCGDCGTKYRRGDMVLRFACRGYPATDGRAPIDTFTEAFEHDMSVDHD